MYIDFVLGIVRKKMVQFILDCVNYYRKSANEEILEEKRRDIAVLKISRFSFIIFLILLFEYSHFLL